MFRGGRTAINKAQGRASDNVKQATEFNSDGSQSPGAPVCTETLPEGLRLRQSKVGLVRGDQAQPFPSAAFRSTSMLQP